MDRNTGKMIAKKILVVEDEPALLKILVDSFTKEGFTVLGAKDGQEGLVSALTNHPDIILLDILMPIMDGMTMLRKLRAENAWGKTVQIIVLTNLNDDRRILDAMMQGTYEYLVKSDWKIEDVIKEVKTKLKTDLVSEERG